MLSRKLEEASSAAAGAGASVGAGVDAAAAGVGAGAGAGAGAGEGAAAEGCAGVDAPQPMVRRCGLEGGEERGGTRWVEQDRCADNSQLQP
eukprot:SAG31_NODE_3798_length_3873_cov_6.539746_5_plen_91_part_00